MAVASQKIRFGSKDLWQIATAGDLDHLETALADGGDINAANNFGLTPLMMAAYHGRAEMVKALVERGADVNAVDNGGLTAARLAKDAGHQETVATFAALGVDTAAPRNKAPRRVGVIHDDRLDAIDDDGSHSTKRDKEDDGSHSTRRDKEVRTLTDPPEIWELVQAAPGKVNRTSTLGANFKILRPILLAAHFKSLRPILLATFALVVIGGVVAWFMTPREQTEADAVAPPIVKTVGRTATLVPSAPVAEGVKPTSARRIRATGRAQGAYVSLTSEASRDQVVTKTKGSRSTHSVITARVSRSYTRRRPSHVSPLTPTRLRRNETAGKEPENASAPAPPASTATPKPKVIQWP